MIHSVHKYKEKKLKLLIANDSTFQLMIIVNSLQEIGEIGSIDEASNGQEALDLVR